jgi:hypothetical protein
MGAEGSRGQPTHRAGARSPDETGGFPDWDSGHPFEYKASDWGWLDGQLVALDYSASVLCEEPHPDMKKWN